MPAHARRFTGETPPSLLYLFEDLTRMSAARNYVAWQSSLIAPYLGNRVIEVGCGTGNLTGYLLERAQVIAVDVEPECVRRVRLRYPRHSNLRVELCGPPDAAFSELRRLEPDCCVCSNVIEHIGRDVEALAAMASILPAGAPIILLAPAFESLYGPIDHRLGHYRRYTKGSLARLARAAGLEIASMRYMNLPGFFAWWANSRVFRRETQSAAQVEFFDRFLVPAASLIERIVTPPFGQSLLAVLRKP
jgi:SAM-dependent methyltransferase